jgi:hypothetical protein
MAIASLAAGCGGSPKPAARTHNTPLGYAQCMQSHGVANFPDPGRNGAIDKDQIIALGNGPQIAVASKDCQHAMPASGLGPGGLASLPPRTRFTDAMAFARCVRKHGFLNFPDPTRSGDLTPQMITAAGINLHQPAVLQAGDACVSASHGGITRAMVARAVAGQ